MMKMNKQNKAKKKMAPWLITVIYFGCIALVLGGLYGVYLLVGVNDNVPAVKEQKTVVVEESDGSQKTVISGEEAFDKDGYALDENGERVKDSNGNYINQLARWATVLLGAEVDPNDFGVDDEGYCYRPSTGERYKTADGEEFTDMDAYRGKVSDKAVDKNE